jgi:hypothetical protein
MLRSTAFVLICALMNAEPQSGDGSASLPNTKHILQEIENITGESNRESREKKIEKMSGDVFAVWKSGKIDALDTNVISRLIPLLDDGSDAARGRVACAIGYFGSRAKIAAPYLRAAEKREIEEVIAAAKASGEKTVMAPAYDSTACIEQALSRIDGASY